MHDIVLSSLYSTVKKHEYRTKQNIEEVNKAMHKFVGVLDRYKEIK